MSTWCCCLYSFQKILSQIFRMCLMCISLNNSQILPHDSHQPFRVLFLCSSLLSNDPVNSSYLDLYSQLCPLNSGSPPSSAWVSSPGSMAHKLSQWSKLGQSWCSPWFFLESQGSLSFYCLMSPFLQRTVLCILSMFYFFR